MWKQLSSKIVYQHPRITIAEDEVELPNGHQTSYIRTISNGANATIIAIRDDGKILVEREYSYPPNEWLYQFPGGGVPDGEDEAEGANRELMEEVGYKGELTHIGKFYTNNRRSDTFMHIFVARNLQQATLPPDPEEEIEIHWLSESEIDALIVKGEILNGPMLAAWTFYKAWKQK